MPRPALLALLATSALACGPGEGNPDAGPTGPTPELFGLVDKRCSVLGDGTNDYTLEVQRDDVTFAGETTWLLIHRYNGWQVRREYYRVTPENKLQLRRVQKWPVGNAQQDTLWMLTAPVDFADDFPSESDEFDSEVEADISGYEQDRRTATISFKSEFLEKAPFTIGDRTVDAFKVATTMVSEGKLYVDQLWFAKNEGFVKFDPDGSLTGDTNIAEMTLQSVRTLEAGEHCVAN